MLSYIISLTLLTLAVILVRAVFRNKMSSRLVYALWLAVLIRMVLPFDLISIDRVGVDYIGTIESAVGHEIVLSAGDKSENTKPQTVSPELSIPAVNSQIAGEKEPTPNIGAWESGESQTGSIQTGEIYIPEINTDKAEEGSGAFIESGGIGESLEGNREPIEIETSDTPSPVIPSVPSVETEDKISVDTPALPSVPADVTEDITVSVKEILDTVWFVGALVTASVFAFSWVVFSTKLVRSRTYLTKSGKIKVYVSDRIASPCVCGIIPKIYVTPEARDSENLSTVILHERVHVSHGDVIWNVIRVAAVSVFWYNPIVWVAAILSKRDAEFACDEAVALKLGDTSKLEYARMIVDMTPAKKNYAVSFAGGPIKERVLKLTRKHKNKIIVAVVVVLVIGICCAATFIGMNYVEGNGGETTTATEKETEKGKETEKESETETEKESESETEPVPDEVQVTSFNGLKVVEATEENLKKYESNFHSKNIYDCSSSPYTFEIILIAENDITELSFNKLIWNEELMVEREEPKRSHISLEKDECIHVKLDSVEIIGYVGISFLNSGELYRCYPATSGKDGSSILVEIDDRLLPDTYREIPADQRHVGSWLYSDISLSITSVTDDAVAFSLYQGKGFSYSAIAVLKDGEYVFGHGISPYTKFSDYYGKTDDSGITGKLVFGEASVKVIADGKFFFNDGLNLLYTSSTGHGGSIGLPDYYTEDRWLLTSESVCDTQEDIRNLLKEKGWFYYEKYSNFYGINGCRGDPNGVDLWGLEITPYDPDYKTPYYTIIGSRGSVSVAVRFAYEKETDSCSVVDVYYADRFGNLLAGEELLSVTHGKTGLDAVLDPSDTALVGFFDSKGPAEKLDGERFEGEENYTDSISPEKIAAMDAFAKENAVIPEELPKFQSDSIYVYPPAWATRTGRFDSEYLDVNEIQKFRYSYFAEPTFLYPLVGVEAVREWYDKVIASDSVNFVATDEMYTVSFVKYFEIPKEKFIEAQNEYRAKILPLLKSYGISTGNENYEEIPADIIYTFDKLIIDRYFWRNYADASDKSTELKAEYVEKAKTDIRYEFIRSLLTKDISALAKLTRYDDAESKAYEKQLAGISTVVFGGYHVSEDMDYEGQFRFGFTVDYSEFDPLPPGKYEMDLSRGIFEPTVTASVRGGTYMTEYTKRDEWFFVENIITNWAGSDFTSQSSSPSLALFYLYEKANGLEVRGGEAKLTLDELHEIARSVYDDPDFKVNTWPFDLVKGEDGGEEYYKVRGMGGNVIFYDILSRGVNGDTITYTVRYFSDHLQLGSACVVQYVIEKTDSPYGFILRDIRKLESSEFEIFSAGM